MKNISFSLFLLVLAMPSCQAQHHHAQENEFKSYNGITYEYEVILPEHYDAHQSYQLAMVFSEIEPKNEAWGETVHTLQGLTGLQNTIFFVPKVPKGKPHWKSHPIHHGLNDLMDHLREKYGKKTSKFHFIGYKEGHNVAQTYSGMSSQYVASLSVTQSTTWKDNKQEWFDQVLQKGIPVFIYEAKSQKEIPLNLSKASFESAADLAVAIRKIDQRLKS